MTKSDNIRSELELNIILSWSFEELASLAIDLDAILDGLELDDDLKAFAIGLLPFAGSAITDINGSLSFTFGIGIEYERATKKVRPYIKGTTGLELGFAAQAVADFDVTVGALSAEARANLVVDNFGDSVVIRAGLDNSLNYFLSDQVSDKSSTAQPTTQIIAKREGFSKVASLGELTKSFAVSITGGLSGSLVVAVNDFPEVCPNAGVEIDFSWPDFNCRGPSCNSVVYRATSCTPPSFLSMLLENPAAIIDSVEDLLKQVEGLAFGRRGNITNFYVPIIKRKFQDSIPNFLAPFRRQIVGVLDDKLSSYQGNGQATDTVADIIANELNLLLGNILKDDITVTYFEHDENSIIANSTNYANVTDQNKIKSLMWYVMSSERECTLFLWCALMLQLLTMILSVLYIGQSLSVNRLTFHSHRSILS